LLIVDWQLAIDNEESNQSRRVERNQEFGAPVVFIQNFILQKNNRPKSKPYHSKNKRSNVETIPSRR